MKAKKQQCYEESMKSLKCLESNKGNKKMCKEEFEVFLECKKKFVRHFLPMFSVNCSLSLLDVQVVDYKQ